jgi:hypothetical protein
MTAKRFSHKPAPPEPPCPNEVAHTPCPTGYLQWWSWVERMNRTHDQAVCEGCGRWAIWYPRPTGAMATCWGCGEAKVDPAKFGDDDELLCQRCQDEREAQCIASQKARAAARLARTWADAT